MYSGFSIGPKAIDKRREGQTRTGQEHKRDWERIDTRPHSAGRSGRVGGRPSDPAGRQPASGHGQQRGTNTNRALDHVASP